MDHKLKGYAIKNAENKRRFESNSRDNRGQQQPHFKRQNVSGPNVARAYTVGNNVERRGYVGALPYCSNCRIHHEGPYTVKCGNCNRVGYMTRDCRAVFFAPTTQRAPTRNQTSMTCYECERQGHYKSECPKLKGQNRGNKTGDKNGNKGAKARAYAIGGGGAGPDSNVVTSTFLLNNHYASMLFDSGADRSFVSTTFSTLFDVIPSTLDTSRPFDIDLMPIELGSFDLIVGMDWLVKYHAVIICDERICDTHELIRVRVHLIFGEYAVVSKQLSVHSSLYRHHCVVMIYILVTPRVSALAGCDRLVSEALVIEKYFVYHYLIWASLIQRLEFGLSGLAAKSCRVEEKQTMKEVDEETIMKLETKMIAKDGTVSKFLGKFLGYTPSKEEEEE
ncbi:putative reverse transcriptase domain-containing protein [Tanacetum coccineum]|uniref:Reverse transcriptase domain-containing protein n=1 Tax=Tanacetum coccineum TaxID=301880 RepID=A0ABQ5GZK3_9ASTR